MISSNLFAFFCFSLLIATSFSEETILPVQSAPLSNQSPPLSGQSAPLSGQSAPLPGQSAPIPGQSSPLPAQSPPAAIFNKALNIAILPIKIQDLNSYNKWILNNKRIFMNANEKSYRKTIFLENLQKINNFNLNPQKTFTQATNQFSDMTDDEFAKKILNQQLAAKTPPRLSIFRKIDIYSIIDKIRIPIFYSVDWRTKGAVTPIKNQGSCGSCWAFSSAGLMEAYNFIKNKSLKTFAEQELLDCVDAAHGYASYGCSGGWPQHALDYATKFGILLSAQYPYIGIKDTCKIRKPTSGYYPKTFNKVEATTAALRSALRKSPVAVLVDASNWAYYASGVYNNCGTNNVLNHAVLAIGFDTSDNWIIKNSWGTTWGDKGFMLLAPGNTCGVLQDNYIITS